MAEATEGRGETSAQLPEQLRALETMIGAHQDPGVRADLWHGAGEMFESGPESAEQWTRAIFCYRKAIDLVPIDEKEKRGLFISHLSNALMERGEPGDIRIAVDASKKVLDLIPEAHRYYNVFVGNYGEAMFRLYHETVSAADFEKAVELIKRSIELADVDDPKLELWYGKLRQELFNRSESTGTIKDLLSAFEVFGEKIPYLNEPVDKFRLSVLLQNRHLFFGSMLDLEKSIDILEKLLTDVPDEENYAAILILLGNNLRIRARRTYSRSDCDRSIELQEKALKWMKEHQKVTQENLAICLGSKASSLLRRYYVTGQDKKPYDTTGQETDLDRAIQLYNEAVNLAIRGPHLGNLLSTLAAAILERYEKRKSGDDLEIVISTCKRALELQGGAFTAQSRALLGSALQFRAKSTNLDSDWEQVIETYECGAICLDSPVAHRIMAADDGGNSIFHRDAHRASQLFETAVNLLPALSPRFLIRNDQQYSLTYFYGTVWSAASACLEVSGDTYKAIQLTERGRGIIASLQLDIHSDISMLEQQHPDLGKRFSEVRNVIGSMASTLEDTSSFNSSNADEVRRLTEEFNSLLATIRNLEGFSSFLDCPTESELKQLAKPGPIVIFSVSVFRSDALLITHQGLKSIPLLGLKHKDVVAYAQDFVEAISARSVKHYAESSRKMKKVLEWLWDVAVSDVLKELGFTKTPEENEDWRRVWWVRAGLFGLFPLHAAGYHETEPRISTIDRVVSSYTPTIKSLAHSRRAVESIDSGEQKVLLVGMPTTADQDDLLVVDEEINELAKLFPNTPSTTIKRNPDRSEIIPILRDAEIFHFSGHGMSSAIDPSLSCLLLNDWKTEPLTVSNLRSLEIQNGRFTYLSACHSASSANSELRLLDESIHISSAFQLAGFRTVVATLWYVYADHSKTVAKELYESMLDQSKILHCDRSAIALHHTVRRLRDELRKFPGLRRLRPDNPLVWAAYILTGA